MHQKGKFPNLNSLVGKELFGAEITQLLQADQIPGVGCDRVKIAQGNTLEPHIHDRSSTLIIIQAGSAIVELNGVEHEVVQGDVIYIPPGAAHGFSTPQSSVEFLSIQAPPIYADHEHMDIRFPE